MRPAAFFMDKLLCSRIIEYHKSYSYLENEDHGKANREFFVKGFVTEKIHASNATQASTEERKIKKRSFRNTPLVVYCLIFINTHDKKRRKVNYGKPKPEKIKGILS